MNFEMERFEIDIFLLRAYLFASLVIRSNRYCVSALSLIEKGWSAYFITVIALEGKDFGLYVYDCIKSYVSYKIVGFREGMAKSCSKGCMRNVVIKFLLVLQNGAWDTQLNTHNYRSIDHLIHAIVKNHKFFSQLAERHKIKQFLPIDNYDLRNNDRWSKCDFICIFASLADSRMISRDRNFVRCPCTRSRFLEISTSPCLFTPLRHSINLFRLFGTRLTIYLVRLTLLTRKIVPLCPRTITQ